MEVNELEHIEAIESLQLVDQLHQLRGAESELRLLSAALGPPPGTFRVQLDPHSGRRRDSELVGHLQQNVYLAELLENYENLMSKLLAHESESHELLVLVAIAHDQMIRVLREPEHRLQLRLAPALEANAGTLAEFYDLFDDVALLIHLDRIHSRIAALVSVLFPRMGEFLVQRLDARAKDVRETKQQWQADTLLFQIVGELEQVELPLRTIAVRTYDDVAGFVDIEEADAPAFYVVERPRRADRPWLSVGGSGGGRRRVFRSRRRCRESCARHLNILDDVMCQW